MTFVQRHNHGEQFLFSLAVSCDWHRGHALRIEWRLRPALWTEFIDPNLPPAHPWTAILQELLSLGRRHNHDMAAAATSCLRTIYHSLPNGATIVAKFILQPIVVQAKRDILEKKCGGFEIIDLYIRLGPIV